MAVIKIKYSRIQQILYVNGRQGFWLHRSLAPGAFQFGQFKKADIERKQLICTICADPSVCGLIDWTRDYAEHRPTRLSYSVRVPHCADALNAETSRHLLGHKPLTYSFIAPVLSSLV